jgi:hypothetical protein
MRFSRGSTRFATSSSATAIGGSGRRFDRNVIRNVGICRKSPISGTTVTRWWAANTSARSTTIHRLHVNGEWAWCNGAHRPFQACYTRRRRPLAFRAPPGAAPQGLLGLALCRGKLLSVCPPSAPARPSVRRRRRAVSWPALGLSVPGRGFGQGTIKTILTSSDSVRHFCADCGWLIFFQRPQAHQMIS